LRNYRKDGSLFWNEMTVQPIKDEEGRVAYFAVIIATPAIGCASIPSSRATH